MRSIAGLVLVAAGLWLAVAPAAAETLRPIQAITVFDHGCSVCGGTVEAAVEVHSGGVATIHVTNWVRGAGSGGSSAVPAANLLVTADWLNTTTGTAGSAGRYVTGVEAITVALGHGRVVLTLRVDAPCIPGGGVVDL